ncbi:MAG TPA: murein transglycosylase domain-containing protein [Steroidobacteraceae bacterium]|nr:murein transglycosylase domain-containing protein [Steroidobacteraceae bacterium]
MLLASCATTRTAVQNAQRVAEGGSIDRTAMRHAFDSDRKVIGGDLQQVRQRVLRAFAELRSNVRKHWGARDTKVASRTVYVKYTQGYRTRVVTDFDHGVVTIETLESAESLRRAIVGALLTPDDPSALDLFSDGDVRLEPGREPYLYGLVHDNRGRAIRTRGAAEQYASYLVAHRMRTRAVKGEEGNETARFVRLYMVRNFEARNAERYRLAVDKYAARYEVSPTLVLAIIRTESNFNPFAVSTAPAYGLMQLVPTTGGREAYRRVRGIDEAPSPQYLFDPDHNIELGAAYLGELSRSDFGAIANPVSRDYCVIAAYNTGPGNVLRTFGRGREDALQAINGIEPASLFERLRTRLPSDETRVYVVRVTDYRREFVGAPTGPAVTVSTGVGVVP